MTIESTIANTIVASVITSIYTFLFGGYFKLILYSWINFYIMPPTSMIGGLLVSSIVSDTPKQEKNKELLDMCLGLGFFLTVVKLVLSYEIIMSAMYIYTN